MLPTVCGAILLTAAVLQELYRLRAVCINNRGNVVDHPTVRYSESDRITNTMEGYSGKST